MASTATVLGSARLLLVGTAPWVETFEARLTARTDAHVDRVQTADGALDAVGDDVDCVVTGDALADTDGLDLVRALRSETGSLPIVLCTANGSERLASDAIAAGVTDYVALSGDDTLPENLHERVERHIRGARRTTTQRDRARQFDAIFHDSRTATWVLEPTGELARVNETARDLIDAAVESLVGQPFWELPWWSERAGTQSDIRQVVENTMQGEFGNVVVTRDVPDDTARVLDIAARPVHDERGTLVAIVIEGVDITDRVELERDLRQSEELHRVTLNNMTDTVLITDEDGEYTYVCPNVHYIFGYTADEIREQGGITDLLGDDLFDREELAERGVLKNIECTATDKAGREHTLLVNVREVSIQDGTLLYSCRDITKRKQREDALTTLQETTRDFLYASTHREIAQHVVEDTPSVLDVEASGVYLFDADANELEPAAQSAAMDRLNGPLATVPANSDSPVSHSFVQNDALFLDDVHESNRLEEPATDLRSVAFIPLGEHGLFVAGTQTVGAFDDMTGELADLLAATAEAALDRVSRESRLRDQDRELQRQNQRLTHLNQVNETIREIDQALVKAETRDEVDHTVCELLTDDDRFSFAWIGTTDPAGDAVEPRAWAGAEQGYLDGQSFELDGTGVDPAARTAASGDVVRISNVASRLHEEAWRKEALSRDFLSVLSIPLQYNDLTYGVLTVYAERQRAFDETSRGVLAELGETIASALSGIERKNALLTTAVTRVTLDVADSSFVLSRLASAAECTVSYEGGVQRTAEGTYVFVTVEDAAVETVEAIAADLVAVGAVQRVSADGTRGVLRLRLTQPFLALELADHGAVFRSATATPTGTRLTIDVPESVDVRHVTGLVGEAFADVTLRSKQSVDERSEYDLYSQFIAELTDRQLEVVQTAYYSGFFESPRENTGEEVAAMLDISPPAFYEHVRTVQRKLFAALFDETRVPTHPGEVE
ncbi:bacterio-opsin activator domain-containing protein [Salarchaeum sp. JOR-1]|uniref:bacterio-opsin activator domain-containing protein n=1 Tax=Salarchaeum sp. JOR-1 TaxID=2599399 RepID=UPI001198C480|nr:bacterio-opsin activator domain-containing protein [Salarchaeum sp. JOR-1]QDX39410.1 PAS domain S-box protein [Salarchaeum sp. JOR-1]